MGAAVIVTLPPVQIATEPAGLVVATGNAFTVTLTVDADVQPATTL